ncbi:condensation domain protein [Mycobacterium kansasii]|uniref:Condensation domain protein n=1 Tax=Mycobacterium kansasii TaxID=1768 RepID=A0A1V3XYB8_MYCKA|nr:condensation domain protein [Mycobacterium kansasii]
MRVVAAVNATLDSGLKVGSLFEAPAIAQLALRVGGDGGGRGPLAAGARPDVVPLSFAQSRLWFLDQLHGPAPVYHMAVALRLRGRLDADALGAALGDVVARHESLRTLFVAPEGCLSSWWWTLSEPTSAGRSLMPPGGRPAGWKRRSAPRPVTRLT